MGEPPKGLTLERKDVHGYYCPENCVWATPREQSRNKRNNRMLTHNGKTMCLVDWADETGIAITALTKRLKKGWSVERALKTAPKRQKNSRSSWNK